MYNVLYSAVQVCGAGCQIKTLPRECHSKQVASVVQVPEEFCDLQVLFITLYSELYRRTVQPEKVCRTATKLVPFLQPVQECGQYPRQVRHHIKNLFREKYYFRFAVSGFNLEGG